MRSHESKPLIGVTACVKTLGDQPFHTVGDKYVRAVATAAQGLALVIPSFGQGPLLDANDLAGRLDGLFLTGSPSNIHPSHYGTAASPEHEPHDQARDATTLPLIRAALAAGLPLFAVCRGMQELNVALGGTLFARLHELPGRRDHRRRQDPDLDVQYGPSHAVRIRPRGVLQRLLHMDELTVSSLHNQGIDRLAPGLEVEAEADDGTIEAVSVEGAAAFALGVQWHPEYKVLDDPVSVRLFQAFGDAARTRARRGQRLSA
ncbi:MAG: gamma-glutamyl-gamma-aminobutyrate hydrolase family protein [Kiloniellales bacterium]